MARPILVEIFADASHFQRELDKAAGTTRRFGAVAKVAGGLVATGLAVGLEKSIHAAIDAQAVHARLEQAFHNAGLSAAAYSKQIDNAEASGRKLGFTDEDVSGSLGSLIAATGNVTTSLRDLSVAQDLARFKHIDLATATKSLTMAMTGSQRAIKQLGLTVSPVTTAVDALRRSHTDLTTAAGRAALAHAQLTDKMATGQAVIAATTGLVHGQAQAFADSAQGGMAQFNAQLQHLEVQVGTLILPLLTKLLGEANNLAASFNANLAPGIRVATAAFDRLHAGVILFKALFVPIKEMLLVWRLEFAALEAAIRAGTAAFNAMRTAASAVATFFSTVAHAAVTALHATMSALGSALNAVHGGFNAALDAGRSFAGFISGGASAALRGFRGIADGVLGVIHAIESAFHAAASAVRDFISALSHIHIPHISLPSLPHIPGFASGVRNFAGGMALVGERGPELVTLPHGSSVTPGPMFGGGDIVLNFTAELDGDTIYNNQKRYAARDSLRNGGTGIRS
jgi:hypothetical protein